MSRSVVAGAVLGALLAAASCSGECPVGSSVMAPVPAGPPGAAMTTARATDRFPTARGDLVVTPLEHASVLLGWNGKAIYVDPTSPSIDDAALPQADLILLTHAHSDHLDPVVVARLRKPGTVVIGHPAAAAHTPLDVALAEGGGTRALGIGVTAVPMANVARGPAPGALFHERHEGNGYVLELGGVRVYLSGDTDCLPEIRALERIDLAFVAMDGRTTMSPAEAVWCVASFRPRVLVPYHYRQAATGGLAASLAGSGIEVRSRNFYPRAETMRLDALAACSRQSWGWCRERLDQARELDPGGEDDPRVVAARAQVRQGERLYSWLLRLQ